MKSKYFSNSKQVNVEIKFKKKTQWVPPRSPYSLIQESLYHDPWKLLLSTIFLQKSAGKSAVPIFWQFIQRWSNPQAVIEEEISEIEKLIQPLGLHRKRAVMFKRFSEEFLTKQWKYPIELHGIGKYGNDSYRIFCINEWKQVNPKDSKKANDPPTKRSVQEVQNACVRETGDCVDLDELLQFEAARQRALNQVSSVPDLNLFEGFIPNRIFISQVDTFNGSHLVKFLTEVNREPSRGEGEESLSSELRDTEEIFEEVEEGNLNNQSKDSNRALSSLYEIIGSLEFYHNQQYRRPEGIMDLLDNEKENEFLKKVLTCGYIIYDITSALHCHPRQIQEAKFVIEVISKRLAEMEAYKPKAFAQYNDCRTFILISPLTTWGRTKPLDPENPTLPFTEKNYRKRKPHANYKAHCELEKKVIELGKKHPKNLRTIVIGAGVPYGHEEDVFHFLFKMAWQDAPHLPIFRPGKNSIPVIHIDSLTSIIYSVITSFPPKQKYIFAADPQSVTLKEVVQLLAKNLGNGKTQMVNEAEAFLYPEVSQREYDMLTINVNVEPGYIMENPTIKWGNDSPFTENISRLIEEFKIARGLLPIKIFIHGPPASGKTYLAKRLSLYYDIPHLHVKGVIDEYIQNLKDKIEAIKNKAALAEEKGKQENTLVDDDLLDDENAEEEDEEESEDIETLKQTLMEIETNMENNERNRLDEEYVIRFFKEKLLSNSCLNKGYVIDGYPKTMEHTKILYEPSGDEEPSAENEAEGQDEDLSRLCNMKIMPAYVESLDASDEFLINRVIKLPARNMTQFEEHEMCRRLTEFRALNTEDNTPLIFYDELDVHPMIYNVENDTDIMMDPTFKAIIDHVGPPKNYGPSAVLISEKLKSEQDAAEGLKAQKDEIRKATEERRENMQKWMFQKNQELEMEEKALLVLGMPLRHYLMKYIFPCLTRGLVEVARIRPEDPIDFLAEFLFRENPEGKMFQPDYDEKEEKLAQAIKEYEATCGAGASSGSGKSSRKSYSTEKSARSDAVSKVSGYKCSLVSSKSVSKKSSKKSSSGKSSISSGVCTCQKSPSLSICSSDQSPSATSSCKCADDEVPEPCESSSTEEDDPCKCPCT